MANATLALNETINQTAPAVTAGPKDYILNTLWPRIHDLILSPAENPDMLWTLIPMMIALILMQIYFGRNKDEALGWNTAFGNSIALIFISVSLLHGVFLSSGQESFSAFLDSATQSTDIRIAIIAFVFLYGIFLSMISFFHWLPEKLAFFIMNGISINVTAYVAIVLVNSANIALDWTTILAALVIFIAVYLASLLIRGFIPASALSRIHLLERKKYIFEQKERFFHHLAMKAPDSRKQRLDAKAEHFQEKAGNVNDDINKLKMRRLRK
jgi:hypothetical protein